MTSFFSSFNNTRGMTYIGMYKPGLISDETSFIISNLFLELGIQTVVILFGCVTNTINIISFIKCRLNDGLTLSFFFLSIADLGFLSTLLASNLSSSLQNVWGIRPYLRLSSISGILGNIYYHFVAISYQITIFIAAQKAACVALPFTFRNIFTRTRCMFFLVGNYAVTVIFQASLQYTSLQFTPLFYRSLNETHLTLAFVPDREIFFQMFITSKTVVLPITAQVFMIFCWCILSVKLKQSSRFRQSASLGQTISKPHSDSDQNLTHSVPEQSKIDDTGSKTSNFKTSKPFSNLNKLGKARQGRAEGQFSFNPREIRALQAVTLVSTIFIICNFPSVTIGILYNVFPEMRDFGRYRNMSRIINQINNIILCLSSSANVFVYWKYSQKFRQAFFSLFNISVK